MSKYKYKYNYNYNIMDIISDARSSISDHKKRILSIVAIFVLVLSLICLSIGLFILIMHVFIGTCLSIFGLIGILVESILLVPYLPDTKEELIRLFHKEVV